jgi:hypothetical protein
MIMPASGTAGVKFTVNERIHHASHVGVLWDDGQWDDGLGVALEGG